MNDGHSQVSPAGRVRRRAPEACVFCRGRKIKCSAERPTCANCRTYGKTCTYAPIADAGTSEQRTQPLRPPKRRRVEPTASPAVSESPSQSQSVSRIVVSANGMPSYHGRTSALYDESSIERPGVELWSKVSEDWVEKGLVAEAARQRQLEQINFRNGKLDFDGVDPDLGMHLLELHWNRQHHSFLLTHRPAFMRDMACGGPYFSKILLNAIFFGASKFSPRVEVRRNPDDVRTAGAQFRERVRELLGNALDKSELTTIQALLVMTNSLFALGDERSAAWLYAGLAFRMIIDLGMHVDATGFDVSKRFTDEDLEIRRRVFWGAFVVDKIQSLYQGRPVTLTEADTFVPIKFLDSYEEYEPWKPFAFSPEAATTHAGCASYSISTFQWLCRLSIILGSILSSIYNERSSQKAPMDLSSLLEDLHARLIAWKESLPAHLKLDLKGDPETVPPNVMSLWALYHVIIILLHRPFVADGHLHSTARSISVNSFVACANAATTIVRILRMYDVAFSVQKAPYLISYATYVAATIHARIASKRGPGSDAHQSLETCLAVFRENQETNFAVRRADAIVRNLIKRLGVIVPAVHELSIHQAVRTADTVSPAASGSGSTSPNDHLFQNLDIDGVIQSFARDLDSNHTATIIDQTGNSTIVPRQPPILMPSPGAFQNQNYAPTEFFRAGHGDAVPNWQHVELPGVNDEASVTVDDLLYGFNGDLLDAFLGTEWASA